MFRHKYENDYRIRMEYAKLKRKEKEDSVKRKDMMGEYEKEKLLKQREEEK